MRYVYKCEKGHEELSVAMTVKEHDDFHPKCSVCSKEMEQEYFPSCIQFKYIPGQRTGAYEYDYGKKATWDLTVPGKRESLEKAGVIRDPFKG